MPPILHFKSPPKKNVMFGGAQRHPDIQVKPTIQIVILSSSQDLKPSTKT